MHLAGHAHKRSMTGKLIRATFQSLQLETGLPGNLFEWEHEEWKTIITKTWASECWKWASDNRVGVSPTIKQLVPRREQDQALMVAFRMAGITKGRLRPLSRCRQFLQVTFVSEIATMSGTHIREDIISGRNTPNPFNNKDIEWPTQGKPSASDWGEWRKALACLRGNHPTKVQQPLGAWIDHDAEWEWFFHPEECRLYRFEPGVGWKFYMHHGQHNRPCGGWFQGPFDHDEYDKPLGCNRAYVALINGRLRCKGHGIIRPC